jgi:hypothetical protein
LPQPIAWTDGGNAVSADIFASNLQMGCWLDAIGHEGIGQSCILDGAEFRWRSR